MSTAAYTHYKELGVAENAAPETINEAYRKEARRCHPDLFMDLPLSSPIREEMNERMMRLNVAHDILSNPEKRTRYDFELHHPIKVVASPSPEWMPPTPPYQWVQPPSSPPQRWYISPEEEKGILKSQLYRKFMRTLLGLKLVSITVTLTLMSWMTMYTVAVGNMFAVAFTVASQPSIFTFLPTQVAFQGSGVGLFLGCLAWAYAWNNWSRALYTPAALKKLKRRLWAFVRLQAVLMFVVGAFVGHLFF